MTIGSLAVNIVANTEKLTKGLASARKQVSMFAAGLGTVKGLLAGFGATLLAGFTIRGLQNTAEEMDKIAKAADRLGVTTEALSGLAYAADLSGSSLEGVVKGLTILQKNLGQGEGATVDAIEKLGLGVQQLQSMDADDAMLAIATAMDRLPNPAQKTAVAMQLFGRAGADLMSLLSEGPDGLRKLTKEAEQLGLTFDREAAAKVELANDAMTSMMSSVKGLARELVITLAPAIEKVSKGFADVISQKGLVSTPGETTGVNSPLYDAVLGGMSDTDFQKFQMQFEKARAAFKAGTGGPLSSFVMGQTGIANSNFDYSSFVTSMQQRQDKINKAVSQSHATQGIGDPLGDAERLRQQQEQMLDFWGQSMRMMVLATGQTPNEFAGQGEAMERARKLQEEADALVQASITPLQKAQHDLDSGIKLAMQGLVKPETLGHLVAARDDALKAANEEAMKRQPALAAMVGGTREAFAAARENLRPRKGTDPNEKTAENTKKGTELLAKIHGGIMQIANGNMLNGAGVIGGVIGG